MKTYATGSYERIWITNDKTGAITYDQQWFVPKGTSINDIAKAARTDQKASPETLGSKLAAKAQEIASGWSSQDTRTRYGSYVQAATDALEKVNKFLRDAGLTELTLDGIDSGTQTVTMPNPPAGFQAAVSQFYKQRGWYMGTYVHNKMKGFYNNPANSIAGLTYNERGPDFTYTADGRTTYFEVLTNTANSRKTHAERHGGSLWRAVYYNFSGSDASDIQ